MSNRLSVAAATATLQDRLLAVANSEVPGSQVVAGRPDAKGGVDDRAGISIFLYEVVTNPFLQNNDLPTRNHTGGLVDLPLAALDLHYLITFHGKENTLEPQRLLGAVIADFSTVPMLRPSEIARSVATRPYLAGADLAEQVERVYLTPIHLSLEEVSRLWSVMIQTPYQLSMEYVATVVLVSPEVVARPNRSPHTIDGRVERSVGAARSSP